MIDSRESVARLLALIDPEVAEVGSRGTSTLWELTVPFDYGLIDVDLLVTVEADSVVNFEVAAQIHDADLERVDAHLSIDQRVVWDTHFDEQNELGYLLLSTDVSWDDLTEAELSAPIDHLASVLTDLIDVGLVQLTDVTVLDDEFLADTARLEGLKRIDPRGALELAADLATRARSLGDHAAGAELDLCAAEVLTELGSAGEATVLADAAWNVLGAPVSRSEVVSTYAWTLSRAGRTTEALAIVDTALSVIEEPDGRAVLIGNKGTLLASIGRRAEAMDWLTAALSDPFLGDSERRTLEDNVLQLGRQSSQSTFLDDEPVDVLAVIDRQLNEQVAALHAAESSEFPSQIVEAWAVAADLRTAWQHMGPAQRVRLLLLEAQLSRSTDVEAARRLWQEAGALAASSGDEVLRRGVLTAGASAGFIDRVSVPDRDVDPFELVGVRFNRALAAFERGDLTAAGMEGGPLEELLEIIEIVDVERFRFRDPGDRRRWSALMSRAYELALTVAHVSGRSDVAAEVLERISAQGLPLDADRDEPVGRLGNEHLHAVLVRLRELPGDLAVARPAAVRATESSAGEGPLLGAVVSAVAGGRAWWWRTQLIAKRLHWCIRSPDGVLWSGVVSAGQELAHLTAQFERSITPSEIIDRLLESRPPARIDQALGRIADVVVPDCLRTELLRAAHLGAPLRVVLAMSAGLESVPLPLLPIGDGFRLIEAATLIVAPPTALVVDSTASPDPALPRAVNVALGADARLGDLADLVGAAGLDVDRFAVLGNELQVHVGTAGGLATPASAVDAWRRAPDDVALYYGHVMPLRDDDPLGAGLRLSDDQGRPTRLTARALLATELGGMCHTMVLAGCSSLGFESVGTGEWWGVACGFLRQGSHYVVGSQWNVVHCPSNVSFVADLTNELRRNIDAASALRDVQLRWLREWERSPDEALTALAVVAHPLIWAAYSVVGMAGGVAAGVDRLQHGCT